MDQFDDLPDVIDSDAKPKFLTEVHPAGAIASGGTISNGLQPLFEEESTTTQMAQQDPDDAEVPDQQVQNATSHDE